MPFLDCRGRSGIYGFLVAPDQVCEFAGGCVDIRAVNTSIAIENYISHAGILVLGLCARLLIFSQ